MAMTGTMPTSQRKCGSAYGRRTFLGLLFSDRSDWLPFSGRIESRAAVGIGRYTAVNLAFATLKIRSLCESQANAEKEFGFAVAKQLRATLTDLRAVDTVLDLPVGRPREVPEKPCSIYAMDLGKGYTLLLRANHNKIPLTETGKIDWSQVHRVMIIGIKDGHG